MLCDLDYVLFTKETLSSISVYLGFRLTMCHVFVANSSQHLAETPNLKTVGLVCVLVLRFSPTVKWDHSNQWENNQNFCSEVVFSE